MEISNESIHQLVLIAGIDEDIGPVTTSLQLAVLAGRFQRPHGGGAHGDDAPAFGLGFVHGISCFLGHGVELPVHLVVLDFFLADRAEGAEAHMQGYEDLLAAFFLDFLQQLLGEVQSSRRSGGTAALPAVHRLVALLVLQGGSDIGRQGSFTQAVENLLENAIIGKAHDTTTKIGVVNDLTGKLVAELDFGTNLQLFAGAHQNLPIGGILAGQQEDLHMGAGVLKAVQARRNNSGVVEHQHIAGMKIFY